jgi:PEP-CTERM motif
MRRLISLAVFTCLMASSAAFGQILYDNKSSIINGSNPNLYGIVTDPGAGAGGFDASVLQNVIPPGTVADTIFGFGHAAGNRLADNFTVPAGFQWTILGAHVFGYTTGAVTPTTTAGVMRFLDGAPNVGTPNVLAGDTTTNVLQPGSNVFLNIYRTLTTDIATATTRRQQDNILTLAAPLILGPGTYWFEYGLTGNNFVPPLQVVPRAGGVVTGDAVQFQSATSTYVAVLDGTTAKGIPFQLIGTASPIPEPTSMALVGLGAMGFAWRRWRKK